MSIIILLVGSFLYFFVGNPEPADNIRWGVTFSKQYAQEMGLDWEKTYLAMLDDLNVSHVRIALPWYDIEPAQDEYTFGDYHFMIKEAQGRGVSVIPVIGHRVPRWPECHTPDWALELSSKERDERVLNLIEREVNEFKGYDSILMWQVENEPFVRFFGECPKISPELVAREVERVRSLDSRPLIVTDSGEWSFWGRAAGLSDVLGVTMYRWVWNSAFDYIKHPFTPQYYARKAELVKKKHQGIRVIGTELQMEPWIPNGSILETPLSEQRITMNLDQFRDNIEFAKKTGLDEHYLWGVEWWYFMKEVNDDPTYWNEAKKLWEDRSQLPVNISVGDGESTETIESETLLTN